MSYTNNIMFQSKIEWMSEATFSKQLNKGGKVYDWLLRARAKLG